MGRWVVTPKEEVIPELDHDINDLLTLTYEDKLLFVNAIARPMASRKLTKRLYKCLKLAASKSSELTRSGVKPVQKFIRRGEKGIVLLAGNVTPIDVYSHFPILCEENSIPYVYVPSKEDIGSCLGQDKSVVVVLIKKSEDYEEQFDKCVEAINQLHSI